MTPSLSVALFTALHEVQHLFRARMRQAEQAQRALQISGVPTLVVDDKYRIGMEVGRRTALDVVDHLIAQELSPQAPGS